VAIGACGLEVVDGEAADGNALDLFCRPGRKSMSCEQIRPDLGCDYNTGMLECGVGLEFDRD
jgi:hypothetical protein